MHERLIAEMESKRDKCEEEAKRQCLPMLRRIIEDGDDDINQSGIQSWLRTGAFWLGKMDAFDQAAAIVKSFRGGDAK